MKPSQEQMANGEHQGSTRIDLNSCMCLPTPLIYNTDSQKYSCTMKNINNIGGGGDCVNWRYKVRVSAQEDLTASRMHCKAVFVRKYSTSLNDAGVVIPNLINHQRLSQTDAPPCWHSISGNIWPLQPEGGFLRETLFHLPSVSCGCSLQTFTCSDSWPGTSSPAVLLNLAHLSSNSAICCCSPSRQCCHFPSSQNTAISIQHCRRPSAKQGMPPLKWMKAALPMVHCVGVAKQFK